MDEGSMMVTSEVNYINWGSEATTGYAPEHEVRLQSRYLVISSSL